MYLQEEGHDGTHLLVAEMHLKLEKNKLEVPFGWISTSALFRRIQ